MAARTGTTGKKRRLITRKIRVIFNLSFKKKSLFKSDCTFFTKRVKKKSFLKMDSMLWLHFNCITAAKKGVNKNVLRFFVKKIKKFCLSFFLNVDTIKKGYIILFIIDFAPILCIENNIIKLNIMAAMGLMIFGWHKGPAKMLLLAEEPPKIVGLMVQPQLTAYTLVYVSDLKVGVGAFCIRTMNQNIFFGLRQNSSIAPLKTDQNHHFPKKKHQKLKHKKLKIVDQMCYLMYINITKLKKYPQRPPMVTEAVKNNSAPFYPNKSMIFLDINEKSNMLPYEGDFTNLTADCWILFKIILPDENGEEKMVILFSHVSNKNDGQRGSTLLGKGVTVISETEKQYLKQARKEEKKVLKTAKQLAEDDDVDDFNPEELKAKRLLCNLKKHKSNKFKKLIHNLSFILCLISE
ncbi:unnamed protein product, partial [Meganyctiphanes norvegica]